MWHYPTGLEHGAADWITTEIEVRICESHGDDDFVKQTGVIPVSYTHLTLPTILRV